MVQFILLRPNPINNRCKSIGKEIIIKVGISSPPLSLVLCKVLNLFLGGFYFHRNMVIVESSGVLLESFRINSFFNFYNIDILIVATLHISDKGRLDHLARSSSILLSNGM